MSPRYAVADTCFVIDWSYYRRRDVLFEVFSRVLVPENVLREVEDEKTIVWLSKKLASGDMVLFTPLSEDLRKAERLALLVASKPHLRNIELPEAVCLVVGKRMEAVVLTENRGAWLAASTLDELLGVEVWRALEVLAEALKKGLIKASSREDVVAVFNEYSRDTRHVFPTRDLEETVREVVACLVGRR